jgi:hypothetical protein
MRKLTQLLALGLLAGATSFFLAGCASDGHGDHHHGAASAKPYTLNTCLVSGEGFSHGKPYTFVHDGQEIKLCCKECLKDFEGEPAKYLKKLPAKQ